MSCESSNTDSSFKKSEDAGRLESKILTASFIGCLIFLLVEIIMAFYTKSKALFVDCIWDGTDLLILIPMMSLVTLLRKPVSERRPYGFSQVETIILVVKGLTLVAITGILIVDGIKTIVHGGNLVNGAMIAAYQFIVSAICGIVYLILHNYTKKISSPTAEAEIFIWKLDCLSTLGVSIGFVMQVVFMHTSLSWIGPYVDPAIAIIMALLLIREPIKICIVNIRNLVLFAPEKEIREEVKDIVEKAFQETNLECSFLELIKTGRKLWIEIYFTESYGNVNFSELKMLKNRIENSLSADAFENIYVSFTADLDIDKK